MIGSAEAVHTKGLGFQDAPFGSGWGDQGAVIEPTARTWSKKGGPVIPPSSIHRICALVSRASCSANRFHDAQDAASSSTNTVMLRARTGVLSAPTDTA